MIYSTASDLVKIKEQNGRLLGIDYGERCIGLAVSDLSWTVTRALPIADVKKVSIFSYLKELVEREGVKAIIIGDPRHMSGDYGVLSQKVHQFCQKLSHHVGIPIMRFDERMTSMMAEKHMIADQRSRAQRKGKIDSVAACYILQGFLDSVTSKSNF
ncbi:MAG: Holliday junction resolvase RuvX [Alphaproteobacteria bacterium]|nr:MAG: Holliday junction resolvase RuvX [Alphaproteobacteria bacterium]